MLSQLLIPPIIFRDILFRQLQSNYLYNLWKKKFLFLQPLPLFQLIAFFFFSVMNCDMETSHFSLIPLKCSHLSVWYASFTIWVLMTQTQNDIYYTKNSICPCSWNSFTYLALGLITNFNSNHVVSCPYLLKTLLVLPNFRLLKIRYFYHSYYCVE